jgi:hypothetical protein
LIDAGLVLTTRHGTLIEPRNFNRSFDRRITRPDSCHLMGAAVAAGR